jgi:hypothetical protein
MAKIEEYPEYIQRAIKQAKLDGHKGVKPIFGGWEENHKYNKLLSDGLLETFTQKFKTYDNSEYFSECILMRKPKK